MKITVYLVFCTFLLVRSEECDSSKTCSECVRVPGCFWNLNDEIISTRGRCFSQNVTAATTKKLYNPESSITITQNKPIDDNILLAPQEIKIKLRLHNPVYFTISFKETDRIQPSHFENIIIDITNTTCHEVIVRVEGISCPENSTKFEQKIQLHSEKTNQTISLEIQLFCTCPCEQEDQVISHSPQCNDQGTYKCGNCECNDGYFGKFCECYGKNVPDDCTSNGLFCSDRGVCVCGICECDIRIDPSEVISGRFCECDNFSCDTFKGQLCSGVDHGICVCGKCECMESWTGSACNLTQNVQSD